MKVASKTQLKVADEVWIATALLHSEDPTKPDFAIDEIVERAAKEAVGGPQRPGVYVHVVQHCVANRPANPGRYRILFETGPGRRRLFRKGDPYHPSREGGKIRPDPEELPANYRKLLGWYSGWAPGATRSATDRDSLLTLSGSGKHLWSDEHADAYVRRIREGWE